MFKNKSLILLAVLAISSNATTDLTAAPIVKTAGQWSATGSMNTARFYHTATRLANGKVLVTGSYSGGATAELYDPSTGTWSNTAAMSTARSTHTATLLSNGKVLVAGGGVASAELYDPSTATWSNTGSMSTARYAHTATLLPNGKVLVAGGGVASAELYDPSTATWSNTAAMSTARSEHNATLLPNGKVLVAGSGYATAELYDPSTATWSNTGSMSTARSQHTATLLPNGKVLATGGHNNGEIASAELYDPSTTTWSSTGSLITARRIHTATILPNGQVLVAGGYPGPGIANAELYTTSTATWSNTGFMNTGRYYHTATLLTTGQVLVAGGFHDNRGTLATAELYDPGAMAPTAVTNAPTVITSSSARFSGTVTPNGATTTASFDYGLTTSYGQTVTASPASIAATATATAVSANVTGLNLVTTYHYRVKATNSAGTSLGLDKAFTTTAPSGSIQLTNGVTLTNQSLAVGEWKYYYLTVPSGASNLTFSTSAGSTGSPGDVDIYTQINALPDDTSFICTSAALGSDETCAHPSPAAGTWWLGVFAYADSTYTVAASFIPPKITQTLSTFSLTPASIFVGSTATASATASSGLTVTFTSTTPNICTLSNTTITGIADGTCTIAADQAGNSEYAPAPQLTKNLTVVKKPQTIGPITLTPATLLVGDVATASATASSTLPVTFSSLTTSICSATGDNGTTVTALAAGTCTIAANQAGDTTYLAATQVTKTVNITKKPQTIGAITFDSANLYRTSTVTASAAASSNLPVVFTSLTTSICSATGTNGATITGLAVGTCNIAANQPGDATYLAAPQSTKTIAVTKKPQTITLTCDASSINVGKTATCSASSDSTLTVNIAATPSSICSYSANTVTGLAVGTCTITATQPGDATYAAATPATHSITVTKADNIITLTCNPLAIAVNGQASCNATATSGLTVSLSSATASVCTLSNTSVSNPGSGNVTTTTVTGLAVGTCTIAGKQNGNANYNLAPPVTQNIAVGGNPVVTPSAGTGGSVAPNTPQTVALGTTVSFTVTANSGYSTNATVTGTCPQGSWNSNQWTTGAINTSCSVNFSFTLNPVVVNGQCGSANGGKFATAPTTNLCNAGNPTTVTGTGPWTWTCTGLNGGTTASCAADSNVPVNTWLNPPTPTVLRNQPFTLDVTVNSQSVKVGSYTFVSSWNTAMISLDKTYQDASGQCSDGICPGVSAVTNQVNLVDDNDASVTLNGTSPQGQGVGPGNDLQMLVLHFKTKLTTGTTPVTITTSRLKTPEGGTIGLGSRGTLVNISYGLCGDSDGNLSVNIVDALAIARKVVGLQPPPTVDTLLADVDRNGTASIVDAMHIARYSVGLLTPPEVCAIGQPL